MELRYGDTVIRYAYINANGVVVQITSGELTPELHNAFMRDYATLYGAARCVSVVDESQPVWIGGTYDDADGFAPPAPEPLPEPLPEVITELQP